MLFFNVERTADRAWELHMNHEFAAGQNMAQRYLLNELREEEREAFEEHYFDCTICAEDVKTGVLFVENAKALWQTEKTEPLVQSQPASWLDLFRLPQFVAPAALAAALALVVAWQSFVVIPDLQKYVQPQVVASLTLLPQARGEERVIQLGPDARSFQLTADIPFSEIPLRKMVCSFQNAGGNTLMTLDAPVTTGGSTLNFLLPARRFPPGQYTLVVSGMTKSGSADVEIERYRWLIRQ